MDLCVWWITWKSSNSWSMNAIIVKPYRCTVGVFIAQLVHVGGGSDAHCKFYSCNEIHYISANSWELIHDTNWNATGHLQFGHHEVVELLCIQLNHMGGISLPVAIENWLYYTEVILTMWIRYFSCHGWSFSHKNCSYNYITFHATFNPYNVHKGL